MAGPGRRTCQGDHTSRRIKPCYDPISMISQPPKNIKADFCTFPQVIHKSHCRWILGERTANLLILRCRWGFWALPWDCHWIAVGFSPSKNTVFSCSNRAKPAPAACIARAAHAKTRCFSRRKPHQIIRVFRETASNSVQIRPSVPALFSAL